MTIPFRRAVKTFQNLITPGKKWHISPYLSSTLQEMDIMDWVKYIPIYQSVIMDLIIKKRLPERIVLLEDGSSLGIGIPAVIDTLLAWQLACDIHHLDSGITGIEICKDNKHLSSQERNIFEAFANTVTSRPGNSSEKIFHKDLLLESTLTPKSPNLILWGFQDKAEPDKLLKKILSSASNNTIFVGLEWQRKDDGPPGSIFRWRHSFLSDCDDWITIGPCGSEYGKQLPENCLKCNHGRREMFHLLDGEEVGETPPWSYVILEKSGTPESISTSTLISREELNSPEIENIDVRYIGTVREKVPSSEHPDNAMDDPNGVEWREYLKVCPGNDAKVKRVAIERFPGMQIPPLQYGQWLHLRAIRAKQYRNHSEIFTLNIRDETSFARTNNEDENTPFLNHYDDGVKRAVDEAAFRLFGFPSLRPFQHIVLEQALTGQDILAIAATGGGKSECFILPAVLFSGITVIISPLKSLILDQYEQRLRIRYGLDHIATFINGDVPFYDRQARLRRMIFGHYQLIYMTPEQLERTYVLEALQEANRRVGVRYLAMDEAHCISQWGHDFRPSYLNIIQRLRTYNLTPCRIALTATASPLVRDDICSELKIDNRDLMHGGNVHIDSSNRPELNLVALNVSNPNEKADIIVRELNRLNGNGSAIVFMPHTGAAKRKGRYSLDNKTEPDKQSTGVVNFAEYLKQQIKQPVAIYHGRMQNDDSDENKVADKNVQKTALTRQSEQRAFISGKKPVMVATKGFGMGIDKPDIRLVIHSSPPANLEAYAQEAGRAGRDQKQATAILLVDKNSQRQTKQRNRNGRNGTQSDWEIQQYFIDKKYTRRQDIQAMLAFLRSDTPRRINGRLYFTNDQVMKAFDRYAKHPREAYLPEAYEWPTFPPRLPSNKFESDDHARILDRGYEYREKSSHINRILDILMNHRPEIDGKLLPIIQSVFKVGMLARKFRLLRPDEIIESSAYYGQYMQRSGITPQELKRLLSSGNDQHVDVTALAKRLNLSLRETVAMLNDIRCSKGATKNNHWNGALIDFWWIESPRLVDFPDPYSNLTRWREYAGANRRERPKSSRKTLDDYFPWRVVNRSDGWEVEVGEGLNYPDFNRLVDQLMQVHDERKANDEHNFSYLIERYARQQGKGNECLRSLLLGYLKTDEVVIGQNCFGCSVCVPDLDFSKYSLEQRQAAVIHLQDSTVAALESIDQCDRKMPPFNSLTTTVYQIQEEDSMGRSGTAYLDSWLARVIQDDPQHQGALWLRLYANERGLLQIKLSEVVKSIERLARVTKTPNGLRKLSDWTNDCLEMDQRRTRTRHITLMRIAATLARKQAQWEEEESQLRAILALLDISTRKSSERTLVRQILSRLLELYGDDGPLTDATKASDCYLQLARHPETGGLQAREYYNTVIQLQRWEWVQIEKEISNRETIWPAEVLLAWFNSIQDQAQLRAASLWLQNNHQEILEKWSISDCYAVWQSLNNTLQQVPIGKRDVSLRWGEQLVRQPELGFDEMVEVYGDLIKNQIFHWGEVENELKQPFVNHQACLLAWLDFSNSKAPAIQVLNWLNDNLVAWATWTLEEWAQVRSHLETKLDEFPMVQLQIAEAYLHTESDVDKGILTMLRAWGAGAALSTSQTQLVAFHILNLPEESVAKTLSNISNVSSLLISLLEATSKSEDILRLLTFFSDDDLLKIPNKLSEQLMELIIQNREKPSVVELRFLVIRTTTDISETFNLALLQLCKRDQEIALDIANTMLSITSVEYPLFVKIWPYLLQVSNHKRLRNILNKMSIISSLAKGNDEFATCLQIWRVASARRSELQIIKNYYIEGYKLRKLVGNWSGYLQSPHWDDFVVILVRYVRSRSARTWLTPVSLEIEVLCNAGRFSEATSVISEHPDIRVGKKLALQYLRVSRTKMVERSAEYESTLQTLWSLILDDV